MDNLPFKRSFILNGKISSAFLKKAGMAENECTEGWLCDHPRISDKLVRQLSAAGLSHITAPTFGANRALLSKYSLGDKTSFINGRLVSAVREAAFADTIIGGGLSPIVFPSDSDYIPSFEELCDIYSEQISALKAAGTEYLHFASMTSLLQARAGLIAAKQAGLPAFITIAANENGRTEDGSAFLPCLLTLQAEGADGFGMDGFELNENTLSLFADGAQYAKIPLIAMPDCSYSSQAEALFTRLLSCGVSIHGFSPFEAVDGFVKLSSLLDRCPPSEVKKAVFRAATNENEVFFLLDDENLCLSQPLDCAYDMSEDIIDLEDESINVIHVKIHSRDEALILAQNAHISRLPIAISADSTELLRYALMCYNGIALVTSDIDADFETLAEVAGQYGAIVI